MGTCIGQVQSSLDEKTEKPAEEESQFFMNPSLSTKCESLSDWSNALTTAGVEWRKVSAACFADSVVFMGQVGKWKSFVQEVIIFTCFFSCVTFLCGLFCALFYGLLWPLLIVLYIWVAWESGELSYRKLSKCSATYDEATRTLQFL